MPHLCSGMMEQHQHAVPPVKPRVTQDLFSTEDLFPSSSPISYSASPPTPRSPVSPISGGSPNLSYSASPAKLGKKKARNRPPKHVRKGTSLARKSDDLQLLAPQCSLNGALGTTQSEAGSVYHAPESNNRQSNDQTSSRVVSAPIAVPLRIPVAETFEPILEALSSPKWLGTGFSDRTDVQVVCTAQHCSAPMISAASNTFTYFANSMW